MIRDSNRRGYNTCYADCTVIFTIKLVYHFGVRIMDMKLADFLMNSPYASWVMFLSAVVFTVGAFAYIAEKLSQDHTRRAMQNIWMFLRPAINDLRDLYRVEPRAQSGRSRDLTKWLEITIYCVFAAVIYLYFVVMLLLIFSSDIGGMKLIYGMLFSFSLFAIADVYRRYAHRVRAELVVGR